MNLLPMGYVIPASGEAAGDVANRPPNLRYDCVTILLQFHVCVGFSPSSP